MDERLSAEELAKIDSEMGSTLLMVVIGDGPRRYVTVSTLIAELTTARASAFDEGIEAAAKVCDEESKRSFGQGNSNVGIWISRGLDAAAIRSRALKKGPPAP